MNQNPLLAQGAKIKLEMIQMQKVAHQLQEECNMPPTSIPKTAKENMLRTEIIHQVNILYTSKGSENKIPGVVHQAHQQFP